MKYSTRKLTRLFKENPDIEKDAFKVREDRLKLVALLYKLIEYKSLPSGINKF